MGLMGHTRGEEAGHGRWSAPPLPNPKWTRGGGVAPLFPSSSPSFPLSPTPLEGKGGESYYERSPSRTPPSWRITLGPASSSPPLYTGVGGTPKAHKLFSWPCAVPPSTNFHLGHIVVVLRRSPTTVTSSSPSSHHRADEALPRHPARLKVRGTSPSRTCADRGGTVRSVLGSVGSRRLSTTSTTLLNVSAFGL